MISRFSKRIILLFNYLAILLLALGFAAGKISPVYFPMLVLFALSFHVIIILNVLFIFIWALFRKHYFLYSLIALFLFHNPVLDTFNVFRKKEAHKQSTEFTVLSYNVKVFDLYNWRKNKKSSAEIFSFIRSVSPDIACIQEYFNSSNRSYPVHDSLMSHQKFKYSHIFYSDRLKNGHNFGIATYSAFPIVNEINIPFTGTHNLAIASDIKIGKDTMRVFNCHMESVRFLKEDYNFMDSLPALSEERRLKGAQGVIKRLKRAAKIRAQQAEIISKQIDESPYPVLFCGDFNDVPASYTYQTLSKNLDDSFKQLSPGMGGTYPRFFPPLRIDYILFSEPIQCNQFKSIRTNLSDHYPVYGTYSLP